MLFSLELQDIKVSLWLPRKGMSLVDMDTAFDGTQDFSLGDVGDAAQLR